MSTLSMRTAASAPTDRQSPGRPRGRGDERDESGPRPERREPHTSVPRPGEVEEDQLRVHVGGETDVSSTDEAPVTRQVEPLVRGPTRRGGRSRPGGSRSACVAARAGPAEGGRAIGPATVRRGSWRSTAVRSLSVRAVPNPSTGRSGVDRSCDVRSIWQGGGVGELAARLVVRGGTLVRVTGRRLARSRGSPTPVVATAGAIRKKQAVQHCPTSRTNLRG